MKTYYITDDKKHFYFQNYDRINESVVFNKAYDALQKNTDCTFSEKEELPYLDVIKGAFKGVSFSLGLDTEDGAFVYCDNMEILTNLRKIIEDA